MPAAPFIVAIAGASGLSAALGSTVVAALGVSTVSAATAAAVGTGIISGVVTAAQGGDVSDVLKSSIIGGVASGIGSYVGGEVTDAIIKSAELAGESSITNTLLAKVAGQTVSGGIRSGITAVAYGKDPVEALIKGGLTAGLTSGVMEGINLGTSKIEGFDKIPDVLQRATKSAIAAGVVGKDIGEATLNSFISSAGQSLGKELRDVGTVLKNAQSSATNAYRSLEYSSRSLTESANRYNEIVKEINTENDKAKQLSDEANDAIAAYENGGKTQELADVANEKIKTANAFIQNFNIRYQTELNPKLNDEKQRYDVSARNVEDSQKLYDRELTNLETIAEDFKTIEENNLEIFIDKAKEFEIKQQFVNLGHTPTNAEIKQFLTDVPFDIRAQEIANYVNDKRPTTSTEVQQQFEDLGYTPTEREIEQFVGKDNKAQTAQEIAKYVDPYLVDINEVKDVAASEGVILSDEDAAKYVQQKKPGIFSGFSESRALSSLRSQFDPLAVNEEEAKQFFAEQGFTPTKAELADYVGNKKESDVRAQIAAKYDPLATTEAEAKEFFRQQGYTPTKTELSAYVGNKPESTTKSEITSKYDPLAVTREEALQYFAKEGYVPTEKELASYIGNKPESTIAKNIALYADPRVVTEQEAKDVFKNAGYTPTPEQLKQFIKTGNEAQITKDIQSFASSEKTRLAEQQKVSEQARIAEEQRVAEERRAAEEARIQEQNRLASQKPVEQQIEEIAQEVGKPTQSVAEVAAVPPPTTDTAPARSLEQLQDYVNRELYPGAVVIYFPGQLEGLHEIIRKLRENDYSDEAILDFLKSEQDKGVESFWSFLRSHTPQQVGEPSQGVGQPAPEAPKSPIATGVAVGESATPPETGGEAIIGSGSGQTSGLPIFSLIAVDAGVKTYDTGNGFTLFAFSDGKQKLMNNETKVIVDLTPEESNKNIDGLIAADAKAAASAGAPITEPVEEPLIVPTAPPDVQAQPPTEPVIEPPVVQPVVEPVKEPTPVVEPVTKPVDETITPPDITTETVPKEPPEVPVVTEPPVITEPTKETPAAPTAAPVIPDTTVPETGVPPVPEPAPAPTPEPVPAPVPAPETTVPGVGTTGPATEDITAPPSTPTGTPTGTEVTGGAATTSAPSETGPTAGTTGTTGTTGGTGATAEGETGGTGTTGGAGTTAGTGTTGPSTADLQKAIDDLTKQLADQAAKTAEEEKRAQAAAQQRAAAAATSANQAFLQSIGLGGMGASTIPVPQPSSELKPLIVGQSPTSEFEGPLDKFFKLIEKTYEKPETQQQQQAAQKPEASVNYYTYGQPSDIDKFLNPPEEGQDAKSGGLITPLMAAGGMAPGGLNIINHSGKARLDFRKGAHVAGPGDGQSDDIPAMLADGEFVFPADVVAALGNGSTKAGSDKLYEMMHSIRARARSAKPKDLPPPALKSPLEYLGRR